MTNIVITYIEKEIGILKTEVHTLEPQIIAWAKNFLASITPVIEKAATDAVLAAVAVPGDGTIKAAAALAAATADLATQGIPVVENDLKAAIQIAYNNLPSAATGAAVTAVVAAADSEVDKIGTTVAAEVAPTA